MQRLIQGLVLAFIGLFTVAAAHAATLTSATFDNVGGAYVVNEIVVDGTAYDALIGPTSVPTATGLSSGGNRVHLYKVESDSFDLDTATNASVLLGANGLTVRGYTSATTVDALFATPINAGDDAGFFVMEQSSSKDTVAFTPLDQNGNPIGTWTTGVVPTTDWTNATPVFSYDAIPDNTISAAALDGYALTLSDFTGGTGTLTGVYGFRMYDADSKVDPAIVGQYAVPEPASAALLLLGLGGLLILPCRRREELDRSAPLLDAQPIRDFF